MHKCVRCGRIATTIDEINAGCPCGSKVFSFIREDGEKKKSPEKEKKAPYSYHARSTFTSEDVENIKVLTEGVFLVDINSLSKNPVVLKDEEGIYYVKLPFEQNGKPLFNSKK